MTGAILDILNPFIHYVSDMQSSLLGQTQCQEVVGKDPNFRHQTGVIQYALKSIHSLKTCSLPSKIKL